MTDPNICPKCHKRLDAREPADERDGSGLCWCGATMSPVPPPEHYSPAMKALHNETIVEFFKARAEQWLKDHFEEWDIEEGHAMWLAGEFAAIYAEGASDGEAAYRGD